MKKKFKKKEVISKYSDPNNTWSHEHIKSLFTFLIPILLILPISFTVVLIVVINQFNDKLSTQIETTYFNSASQSLRQSLQSLNATANTTRHNALIRSTLAASDIKSIQALEEALLAATPNGIDVYLIPKDMARIRHHQEQFSFSILNLVSKLEKGEKPTPELIKANEKWQLLQGYPITHPQNDSFIGCLILSFDASKVVSNLPTLPTSLGSSQIAYMSEIGKSRPLISYGDPSNLTQPAQSININESEWTLEYQLTPDALRNFFNPMLYWGICAASTLMCALVLLICFTKQAKHYSSLIAISARKSLYTTPQPPISVATPSPSEPTSHEKSPKAKTKTPKQSITSVTQVHQSSKQSDITHEDTDEDTDEDIMDLDINFEDESLFAPTSQSTKNNNLSKDNNTDTDIDTDPASKPLVQIPSEVFRQYDIRGIVGNTLTPSFVTALGQAIGTFTQNKGFKKITVGRDGRLSSPEFSQALIQGVCQSGCDVLDIGTVPTPVVYYSAANSDHLSGIMITGSHNPADYNGFKMVVGGETLFGQHILDLKRFIEHNLLNTGEGKHTETDMQPNYIRRICSDIILSKPLKVAIDAGNGVAGPLAVKLIEQLGCEVIPLYCDIDGNFPNHHPDPSKPANLKDLIKTVTEHKADVGLAFDGDGDRLGVITPNGDNIFADRLIMLFSQQVLSENTSADGTIIYDVKCSGTLKSYIQQHGGKPIMWKTGHSLIKAKMKETKALLAGEMSGHIFFNDRWFGFDDALYSAARLLEIIAEAPDGLDSLMSTIPNLPSTPEINIPVDESIKFNIISQLTKTGIFSEGQVTTIDGIRVDYNGGWGLVRASNTTPCLVARFEAETEAQLQSIQKEFRQNLLSVNKNLQIPF